MALVGAFVGEAKASDIPSRAKGSQNPGYTQH